MVVKLQFYCGSTDKMVADRTFEFDDFDSMDRFAAYLTVNFESGIEDFDNYIKVVECDNPAITLDDRKYMYLLIDLTSRYACKCKVYSIVLI